MPHRPFAAAILAALPAFAEPSVEAALQRTILDPKQPLLDVQVYTAAKVPLVPAFRTVQQWDSYARTLRARVLNEVIYRGEAAKWRTTPLNLRIEEPFASGDGYRVRRFLFDVIPGLTVPGLIYEPARLAGPTPVVLNVNGHEGNGTHTAYIQARCINLAKKGLIAVNPEWLGKGQLNVPGLNHYVMPQIDLTGTSGVALFHLSLRKSLDIAAGLPNADPKRLAVTGLSGGGWQTIFLASTDTRVAVAMPVAGYSSFVTRAQWPDLDLGDSEQTPSDLGAVADYAHLSAIMAPRVLQVSNNAKDTCCFRADYATGALIQTATPAYRLYNALDKLRYHTNHGAGHNYDADNREALYRLLRDTFGVPQDTADIPVEADLRPDTVLRPPLPADNLDFHKVALKLAEGLPARTGATRQKLGEVVRFQKLAVEPHVVAKDDRATYWKLAMGRAWNVPATELGPAGASRTVILVSDEGRAKMGPEVATLVRAGVRVLALDPFYFGESKIAKRDFLFAMLIAGIGERPLGLQASQVAAAARWLSETRKLGAAEVHAFGPRSSLFASIAAAMEPGAISGVTLHRPLRSLREVLTNNWTVDKYPEMFCFGLLAGFDVPQIEALVAPRPVTVR